MSFAAHVLAMFSINLTYSIFENTMSNSIITFEVFEELKNGIFY